MFSQIENNLEQKQISVLRRKFLVTIPTMTVVGYVGARYASTRFGLPKWPGLCLRLAGAILTPIVSTMLLVHFNKAEIFRIGTSMMRSLNELRERQEGPFADPSARDKWDYQIKDRRFSQFEKVDPSIEAEYSKLDYNQIVNESVSRDKM